MIHPTADVQSAHIGEGTNVWQFAIILAGAVVGNNCNVNCHTFIENDIDHITNQHIVLPLPKGTNVAGMLAHVWHVFAVRTSERKKLQDYLKDNGVQTVIHYPIPPHKQPAYKEWNSLSFPVTEKIHNEILSLPVSPVMPEAEYKKVVEIINSYQPGL